MELGFAPIQPKPTFEAISRQARPQWTSRPRRISEDG